MTAGVLRAGEAGTGGRSRHGLWLPADRITLGALNTLALLAVTVCWVGVATEPSFLDGLYWLQGAITAAVFASAANASFLLIGMRQLRGRRRSLVKSWPYAASPTGNAAQPGSGHGPVVHALTRVVTGARMTSYHDATCLLVRGKDVRADSVAALEAEGLQPCGMCRT